MIAICKTAFAQLRATPAHSGELTSQLLGGEWVKIVTPGTDWSEIETEHGYKGWTRTGQLCMVPENKVSILADSTLYQDKKNGRIYLDKNSNAALKQAFEKAGETDALSSTPTWNANLFCSIAKSFLDTPYVWGGKSEHGLDCSGLVQLSMNLCGFSFPRDAWQQAEMGAQIEIWPDCSSFEEGDLLFFQRQGKRVHHVAISLGGCLYLHASEWVQINSLDPESPAFVSDRKETLVGARRIKEAHLEPLSHAYKSLLNK